MVASVIRCPYCGMLILASELPAHLKVCPKYAKKKEVEEFWVGVIIESLAGRTIRKEVFKGDEKHVRDSIAREIGYYVMKLKEGFKPLYAPIEELPPEELRDLIREYTGLLRKVGVKTEGYVFEPRFGMGFEYRRGYGEYVKVEVIYGRMRRKKA